MIAHVFDLIALRGQFGAARLLLVRCPATEAGAATAAGGDNDNGDGDGAGRRERQRGGWMDGFDAENRCVSMYLCRS